MVMSVKISLNPNIPPLPRITDKTKINVRYILISPYVSVHIYWSKKLQELIYEVEEPILDDNEKKLLSDLEKNLEQFINVDFVVEKNIESIIEYIQNNSMMLIEELGLKISEESYNKIFYYLF